MLMNYVDMMSTIPKSCKLYTWRLMRNGLVGEVAGALEWWGRVLAQDSLVAGWMRVKKQPILNRWLDCTKGAMTI